MPSSSQYWPTGRKLFRQRSRWRVALPVAALLLLALLALVFGPAGWG